MAERGTYRATRGNSLLNVPQVQASDAPAQLLGAAGDVAENLNQQFQRQQMTYQRSRQQKLINDAIASSRGTLAEIEAKNEAAPDTAMSASTAYIRGKSAELSKIDSEAAAEFERDATLNQRLMMVRVNGRFDDSEASNLRASAINFGTQSLSTINADTMDTPEGQAIAMNNYQNYVTSLRAKTPFGKDAFTPEQQVAYEQSWLSNAAEQIAKGKIRKASAEQAKEIETQARDGSWTIETPAGQKKVSEALPQQVDMLVNMAQERQRELQRSEDTFTAAQYIDAVNAQIGQMDAWQTSGAEAANMLTPEQVAITWGKGELGAAKMMIDREQAIAAHDGFSARPDQRQEIEMSAGNNDIRRKSLIEAFNRADSAIAEDSALYMIQTNPEVQKAMAAVGPSQGPPPYINALNAAYDAWGLAPEKRRILPKTQAAVMAGQLIAPNPDGTPKTNRQIQSELTAMTDKYGEYAPQVMHELYGEKLSGKFLVVADLPTSIGSKVLDGYDQLPVIASNLNNYDSSPDALEKEIVKSSLYQDFLKTLPTGSKGEAQRYLQASKVLAMKYLADGDASDVQTATDKATRDVIESIYKLDGNVRIPVKYYSDGVGRGLSEGARRKFTLSILDSVDTSDMSFFGSANKDDIDEFKQRLVESGKFINNKDERTGVTLLTQGGNVVYVMRDGKRERVSLSWAELEQLAVAANAPVAPQPSQTPKRRIATKGGVFTVP